jgi:hypothetical protein
MHSVTHMYARMCTLRGGRGFAGMGVVTGRVVCRGGGGGVLRLNMYMYACMCTLRGGRGGCGVAAAVGGGAGGAAAGKDPSLSIRDGRWGETGGQHHF